MNLDLKSHRTFLQNEVLSAAAAKGEKIGERFGLRSGHTGPRSSYLDDRVPPESRWLIDVGIWLVVGFVGRFCVDQGLPTRLDATSARVLVHLDGADIVIDDRRDIVDKTTR